MADVGKSKFFKHLDSESKLYDAGKEVHDMDKRKSVTDHEHKFQLTTGHQVQCNCGWGLYIDINDEVKDGHIFRNAKKII